MSNVVVNDAHLYNIADAIRAKAGTEDTYTVSEMSSAIESLSVGGAELPVLTNGDYAFYGSTWNGIMEDLETNLTSANYMFYKNELDVIPMTINFDTTNQYGRDMNHMFYGSNIKTPPTITNAIPRDMSYMFAGCEYLEEVPESFNEGFITWYYKSSSNYYPTVYAADHLFYNCYRLKNVSSNFFNHCINSDSAGGVGNLVVKTADTFPYYLFYNCYNLREVVDMEIDPYRDITYETNGNTFNNTFTNCFMLSRLTFKGGERNIGGLTIDLSKVGFYSGSDTAITQYLPENKVVYYSDYEKYKDTDYWTTSSSYSRYNKASAIETINSLPSTSGTNTIKFYGYAGGTSTDGNRIQDMTEEEIAVATAKGWTVTMV